MSPGGRGLKYKNNYKRGVTAGLWVQAVVLLPPNRETLGKLSSLDASVSPI